MTAILRLSLECSLQWVSDDPPLKKTMDDEYCSHYTLQQHSISTLSSQPRLIALYLIHHYISHMHVLRCSLMCQSSQLSIVTHILSTAIPRPNARIEANTFSNARSPATTAARVATDDQRSAGATAGCLVGGDPQRREGTRWAAMACQNVEKNQDVQRKYEKRKYVTHPVVWKEAGCRSPM